MYNILRKVLKPNRLKIEHTTYMDSKIFETNLAYLV